MMPDWFPKVTLYCTMPIPRQWDRWLASLRVRGELLRIESCGREFVPVTRNEKGITLYEVDK